MWKQENDTRHIYMESIKGFESLHSQFFYRIYFNTFISLQFYYKGKWINNQEEIFI